jgi:hypothetical protein
MDFFSKKWTTGEDSNFYPPRSACLVGLEAIFRDGAPVGYVRRADYGFYLDKPVAYG